MEEDLSSKTGLYIGLIAGKITHNLDEWAVLNDDSSYDDKNRMSLFFFNTHC